MRRTSQLRRLERLALRLVERDQVSLSCLVRRPGCSPDASGDICAACWSSGGGDGLYPPTETR